MHPITTEIIARQRMAERHAEAAHYRAVRAVRAARKAAARPDRASNPSLWARVRLVARAA